MILDTYTTSQLALFVEVETEALADELTAQANITAVASGAAFSGKDDGLRSLVASLQGTDAFQGGSDLQGRLQGYLKKGRKDAL